MPEAQEDMSFNLESISGAAVFNSNHNESNDAVENASLDLFKLYKMSKKALKTIFDASVSDNHKEMKRELFSFEIAEMMELITSTANKLRQTESTGCKTKRSTAVPYYNVFDRIVLRDVNESKEFRSTFESKLNAMLNLPGDLVIELSKKRYKSLRGNSGKFAVTKLSNGDILINQTSKLILTANSQLELCHLIEAQMKISGSSLKNAYDFVTKNFTNNFETTTPKKIVLGNLPFSLVLKIESRDDFDDDLSGINSHFRNDVDHDLKNNNSSDSTSYSDEEEGYEESYD